MNQVNREGGVYVKAYGRKLPIKLVTYNDRSSTTTAATLYNQLITQDHVDILAADFGSVLTSVAVPIAQEHKMLLFDQTGTGAGFFILTAIKRPSSDAETADLIACFSVLGEDPRVGARFNGWRRSPLARGLAREALTARRGSSKTKKEGDIHA